MESPDLALVVAAQALRTVLYTFNQSTPKATSGKVTLGSIGTNWTASVAIFAIRSSFDFIFKIHESRSYIVSQLYADWLKFILTVVISVGWVSLFSCNFFATMAHDYFRSPFIVAAASVAARVLGWIIAAFILSLSFAIIYFWAPGEDTRLVVAHAGRRCRSFRLASILAGAPVLSSVFNHFSAIYGSLGAVVILVSWFYICGLMLLLEPR